MDIAAARRRAKLADAAIAKGEDWGPLHGLPVTIKDSFDLAGLPATWGVPELKDHRPAGNAFTRSALSRCWRHRFRQDQRPRLSDRLGNTTTRSMARRTTLGTWSGRRAAHRAVRGGTCRRPDRAGCRRGFRRRHPQRRALLRDLWHKSTYGMTNWDGHVHARHPVQAGPCRLRSAGTQRRGPEAGFSLIAGPESRGCGRLEADLSAAAHHQDERTAGCA